MNFFKERCVALREKDYTLAEIMRATGRSKTSVYFHIRNIPLSAKRQQLIREATIVRARAYSRSRKGKSVRAFRTFNQWSADMVLLIAHLSFDGDIVRGECIYNNRSIALIERVERLMCKLYDYAPRRYLDVHSGVTKTCYFNVALDAYLQRKAKDLFGRVDTFPRPLKREFLRAFFDDEGCMDFRPESNRRKVRGYQKDVRILKIIQKLLTDFSIDAKVVTPNEVVITGKENLLRFEREINFSPGVYINGKRSNSRWKKHLEKRQILRMAIESFQS